MRGLADIGSKTRTWQVLLTLSGWLLVSLSLAASTPLQLKDGSQSLLPHVTYQLDSASSDLRPKAFPSIENFSALWAESIHYGYTDQRLWLAFSVFNNSDDLQRRVIRTGQHYMRPMILYTRQLDGQWQELFYNDQHQRFGERPSATAELAFPIAFEPGETRHFLVYVGAAGALSVDLELTTLATLQSKEVRSTLSLLVIAGILIALALMNLFHSVAMRSFAHLAYVAQITTSGLFLFHMDGQAFQYLWPDWPTLNQNATQFLGHGANVAGGLFAISFLRLQSLAPRLYLCALAVVIVSAACLLLIGNLPALLSNQIGTAITAIAPLVFASFGVYAWLAGNTSAMFFVVGWVLLGIGNLMFGFSVTGIIDTPIYAADWVRFGVLAEGLILSLGLVDQVRRLNVENLRNQSLVVEGLERRLQESLERIELEEQNMASTRLVAEMDERLATTSHDVRQPIHALRLSLLSLSAESTDGKTLSLLNRTLDQMESLLTMNLEREWHEPIATPENLGDLVSDTVAMFEAEANQAGVELRSVACSLPVVNDLIVPLQRIVQNAVVNALKHADCQKILVGVRRRAAGVELNILDDGQGIDERGAVKTAGNGLGLSIIREICRSHDFILNISSSMGHGTRITVLL